ncbi:PAS domain-containing protein [Dongia sedimenti]|uniref:PAS domain-containing protein n=1 Tax=Dongia sedimenti TaxID=3064282 RepID=A0ABU0YGM1_9PROT|nr:PAS domain-containing protein [Rhodospirillaceae bacterium R-7]
MTISFPDPIPTALEPLYRYWDKKRGDRRMPRRADIEPAELVSFLPALMIVDVVADDRRYVYRLVGTREVDARGQDPTGRAVGEAFMGASREGVLRNYDRVQLTGRPHVDTGTVVTTKDRLDDSHVIFLPLSEDGQTVTQILVYTVYDPEPPTA